MEIAPAVVRPVLLPFGVFSLVGWAVWDISDKGTGKGDDTSLSLPPNQIPKKN